MHRVNDPVRQRQKKWSSMNVTENNENHSVIWRTSMSVTLESAVYMGKKYSDNGHPMQNTKHVTMNTCSTFLQNWCQNKKRTMDWRQLIGKILHGSICLWWWTIHESLAHTRCLSFRIQYCVLVRYTRTSNQTLHGNRLGWLKTSQEYRNLDRIDGEPMEFEGEYFPRIQFVATQSRSQWFFW